MDHNSLQREFSLLVRVEGPPIVPRELMRLAKTYRQSVRLCLRIAQFTRPGLRPVDVARECGLTRQHVTDYFHEDDKPSRRSLPADRVAEVEEFLENSCISQWLARNAKFTVLEELQAARAAA